MAQQSSPRKDASRPGWAYLRGDNSECPCARFHLLVCRLTALGPQVADAPAPLPDNPTDSPIAAGSPELVDCLASLANRIATKANEEWRSFDYVVNGGKECCPRCGEKKDFLPPVARRHLQACFGKSVVEQLVAAAGALWQRCTLEPCNAPTVEPPALLAGLTTGGHYHDNMRCPWGECFSEYSDAAAFSRHFTIAHTLAECQVRTAAGQCDWKFTGKAMPKLNKAVASSKAMKEYQSAMIEGMAKHLEGDHAIICSPNANIPTQATLCSVCDRWLVGLPMLRQHSHKK